MRHLFPVDAAPTEAGAQRKRMNAVQTPLMHHASLPTGVPVLAICAHPDDLESWCGGTLALLVERDCDVRIVICTDGEKGSADRRATAAQVGNQRREEQRAAAARLGIRTLRFLGWPDGELEEGSAMRGNIVRLLRQARPQVVFTHDPEHPYPPYTAHRDHRVLGRVVLDAMYPMARDHLYFPEHLIEGLEPHNVRQAWLFSTMQPTTAIDISSTLERKIVARLEHRSQTVDPDALRVGWRERAAAIGADYGLPAAETFAVVDLG